MGGAEAFGRGSSDAGDLLGRSIANTGVETQKRSPIVNEPRVRGYHIGQIVTHADGAFWFPARQDLDTFFSKIDSGVVQNVQFDPDVWFSGSAARLFDEVGGVLNQVYALATTPEDALAQIKDRIEAIRRGMGSSALQAHG